MNPVKEGTLSVGLTSAEIGEALVQYAAIKMGYAKPFRLITSITHHPIIQGSWMHFGSGPPVIVEIHPMPNVRKLK